VLITADNASDARFVDALASAAATADAKPVVMVISQLPYQGSLADPHVPEALGAAVQACDVWFDVTFPYLAGSGIHERAMHGKRARYMLLGDLTAAGADRLYGRVSLDALFEVQRQFDGLMRTHAGATCRVTNAAGTDFSFKLGKPHEGKSRKITQPGMYTVCGGVVIYPEMESVRGTIVADTIFHESYVALDQPLVLAVDDKVRELRDGGPQRGAADRALRRASRGEYGRVIHLTCGFHPAAQFQGRSFIEDSRCLGSNAIGLGQPWWEPGGGENHPDAIVSMQSLWIGGEQVVDEGVVVGPQQLREATLALTASTR
jgi:hypothetical protein